ncbi:MAG TPA: hypothetical protein VF407_21940, partial [Polyangiaceae bacterium]
PGAHGTFSFADDGSAGQAEGILKMMAARTPALRAMGDLKIERSASDLNVDLPISPLVRDLILSQGGSDHGGDAPDSRPQEIKPGKKKKGH